MARGWLDFKTAVILIAAALVGFLFLNLFTKIIQLDDLIVFYMPILVTGAIIAYYARSFSRGKFLTLVFLAQFIYLILFSFYGPDGSLSRQDICRGWNVVTQQPEPVSVQVLVNCTFNNLLRDIQFFLLLPWITILGLLFIRKVK